MKNVSEKVFRTFVMVNIIFKSTFWFNKILACIVEARAPSVGRCLNC